MSALKRVMEASGISKEGIGLLFQGHSIASLRKLDPKMLDAMYALGHQNFVSEKYETARSIMRYLCVQDHRNPEYLAALGACEYRLENYPEAVGILSQAVEMDNEDPRATLNLGLSLLKNKQKKAARAVIQQAEQLAAENKEFTREWKLASRIIEGSGKKNKAEGED